jgi:hypothetical protein
MKDLLVYVADADALAFMKAVLERPPALGIRPIGFGIERHPMRDSGMVQSGAELTRMKKGKYHKALLMWDHHGSGRDHRQAPGITKLLERASFLAIAQTLLGWFPVDPDARG